MSPRSIDDVVALLSARSEELGNRLALRYLPTGDVPATGGAVEWSYAEIDRRARLVAARLVEHAKSGDRALLLFAPGLDFVAAFFGCLYAGVIAVPAYPPDPSRLPQTLPRLRAIVDDAGARVLLTTADVLAMAGALAAVAPDLAALVWLPVDDFDAAATEPRLAPHRPDPREIAFLQYTSGSTGAPKGVMVTHANILANERMMNAVSAISREDHGMGWVPLFHDLGLIANVLQTMWVGMATTLISPIAFLKQPMRWLRVISHYRATISGGPDFAYDLCARKATEEDFEGLDLSCWRLAFSSAEPVRAATLDRFRSRFARAGFDPRAFFPALGMAEATLAVTTGRRGELAPTRSFDATALSRGEVVLAEGPRTSVLVSSGRALPETRIAIVDPESCTRPGEGAVGEIWVNGPGVALGYWGQPDATEETFGAHVAGEPETWLRTGDLGFLLDEEVFVTGRRKDLIIVHGHNHYPQDIERTAEASSALLRPGCAAAFSIERDGEERVVLVAEAEGTLESLSAALSAIVEAVQEAHDLPLFDIALIKPRTLRKTSSGKVQRHANKLAYLAGEHEVVTSLQTTRPAEAPATATTNTAPPDPDLTAALDLLTNALRASGRLDPASLSPDATFASLGLDSLALAGVSGALERTLGFEVPIEIFHGQTLAGAARLLADRQSRQATTPSLDLRAEATLPEGLAPACPHSPGAGPILLTGATGFLGAALLAELLRRTDRQIVCLVRATSLDHALTRIREALESVGETLQRWERWIQPLLGDLSAPHLGLAQPLFEALGESVSAIYHCGATVHWTRPYSALRAENRDSVLEVLRLAAGRNVPIHYVSSLGVYPFGATIDTPFAEDGDLPGAEHLRLGYFQSKWVADTVLSAARKRGFTVSIYRPGLISGDSRSGVDASGASQLLAAFLGGCIRMGSAPLVDKVLDVVPVDWVAAAIASISLRPEGLGRSYNLVNPSPLPQLDAYTALREMGYALREVPYPAWRESVMALPERDPQNPLARFALYYRTVTEERMRTMERQMATRLPVEDTNTQAHLPPAVRCPPFDGALFTTYVKHYQHTGVLPLPRAEVRAVAPAVCLVDRYQQESERLVKLYARGKGKQWDAAVRLDWSHELDPDNPEQLPDTTLPIYGSALFTRMSVAERSRVRRHFQAWQLSQTLHGEQGALLAAAKIVQQAPSVEAKLYAANQVADEARHVELFSRLVHEKVGVLHPMTGSLRRLLDDVLSDARWDMTFLGMQVLVEGLALAAFSLNRDESRDPLVSAAYAYVIEDEARHVAFGKIALKDYYPSLTQRERDEREAFVVEAAYLLRDRLQGDEVWKDMGLPLAEVAAHIQTSSFLRSYRRELFSRIVPLVRAIGLWGPRIQAAFGDMGVLGFAQIDLEALAAQDDERARAHDDKRRAGTANTA